MNLQSDIHRAVDAACLAACGWAQSDGATRAELLGGLAAALDAQRCELVDLANAQTHLGLVRLNGELDRTIFQLRAFAHQTKEGRIFVRLDDPFVAGPPPAGHPHMLLTQVPLGPVAMFSASNFPFAFSVLGGDTVSALAAGCPVVVRAHPAHIALSRAVHALACRVLNSMDLPEGLIGHVDAEELEAGLQLVSHPGIAAVAFTGSLAGGQALAQQIQKRVRPIPFYGELGSINPVVVMPEALAQGRAETVRALALSITQGAGQFCTSPGLLVALDSVQARQFVERLAQQVDGISLHAMLSGRIQGGFDAGVASLENHAEVQVMTRPTKAHISTGFVGLASASAFLAHSELRHEVFGACCLCVLATSVEQICAVLGAVGGSLTVTLLGVDADNQCNRELIRAASKIAGRVLFKGVPTGVAVSPAQQHGGPWPASTQPLFTSVGLAASARFLRPISLQDAPTWLLQRGGRPV
jgi:acyl-CoA reductase-like NAD-dependent aldehyde dehydrogenase